MQRRCERSSNGGARERCGQQQARWAARVPPPTTTLSPFGGATALSPSSGAMNPGGRPSLPPLSLGLIWRALSPLYFKLHAASRSEHTTRSVPVERPSDGSRPAELHGAGSTRTAAARRARGSGSSGLGLAGPSMGSAGSSTGFFLFFFSNLFTEA
jgi:hypothetical protein